MLFVIKMFLYILIVFGIFEKNDRRKRIKHDAGEAQDPSRKMRLDKCCRDHGLTSQTMSFKGFDDCFSYSITILIFGNWESHKQMRKPICK